MLATIIQLKERLGITVDTRDGELTTLLEACGGKILDLCRYAETDTVARVETMRKVQQSRDVRTGLRKVKTDVHPFLVEGRSYGTEFLTLTVDLLDADEGVFWVLGAFNWWPLNYVEERRPSYRRWRDPVWPVVRVTYDVTGIGSAYDGAPPQGATVVPGELNEATLALAIHWFGQESAGASDSVSIGMLRQEINREPLPAHVRSMLGSHYVGTGARWVR